MRKNEKITALYERLSRDDFGKDDDQQRESNSISNQKAMLEEFAARQGFTNIVHFTDDGISGTCFDRPGFLAMMKEVEAGNVEYLCIKDMSQAEFIRQAITRATIRPIVTVSPVNDELLSAVGRLTAEYGKIGGNLNQIARALNEYGTPYNALSVEVRAAISDLAALKFEVLRKVGDAVGNIQTYQL